MSNKNYRGVTAYRNPPIILDDPETQSIMTGGVLDYIDTTRVGYEGKFTQEMFNKWLQEICMKRTGVFQLLQEKWAGYADSESIRQRTFNSSIVREFYTTIDAVDEKEPVVEDDEILFF
jgi:hypothetical protein